MILSAKPLAGSIRASLADAIGKLSRKPKLAVILVGQNPASLAYVGQKRKASEEVGMDFELVEFPETVTEDALVASVREKCADPAVDGLIVQFPLPAGIDKTRVIAALDAAKDVDGFTDGSVANVFYGREGLVPCTPKGILRFIASHGTDLTGKDAVIVGHGNLVGKPLSVLMANAGATVTVCHSKTRNLAEKTRSADILIAAAGKAGLITADMVKPGALVVDVGMNRLPDGRLVGDCDAEAIGKIADITGVPGGVGPMTVAMLLENTYLAYLGRK
jgi:methylenetetrahydrofolate dehydrogenase (NADP+)/methenyltetrahydrofolate cyclohydrolase